MGGCTGSGIDNPNGRNVNQRQDVNRLIEEIVEDAFSAIRKPETEGERKYGVLLYGRKCGMSVYNALTKRQLAVAFGNRKDARKYAERYHTVDLDYIFRGVQSNSRRKS